MLDWVSFAGCGDRCSRFSDGRADFASGGLRECIHVALKEALKRVMDVVISSRTIFYGLKEVGEKRRGR